MGVFGGTFDPIHFGHLRLAEEAADACGLEHVLVVPAGLPPHRAMPGVAPEARLAMARLAVADNPRLRVDEREVRLSRPSYTIDTLADLRAELGVAVPLCLLVGGDAFRGLSSWRRWLELFDFAHIIVAERPGFATEADLPAALAREFAARRADAHAVRRMPAGAMVPISITALDISATAIRARLAQGRSVRYLLPDPVLDYIQRNALYV